MSAQALLARNSYHLVDDDDLMAALNTEISRTLGEPRHVADFYRRFSDYYSSYVMEELDLVLDDGRELQLIFKNLSRDGMLEGALRTKPYFLYNPMREIDSYRLLFAAHPIGTAKFYGAHIEPATEQYWLFLERVPGTLLWQFGEDKVWRQVAAWLGKVHRDLSREVEGGSPAKLAHLNVYDEQYYWQWMSRARAFVERTACGDDRRLRSIEYLAEHFEQIVERLVQMPVTVIHGEFYPSNVLVQHEPGTERVCPVDWETAAIGPGLMDLSALTSGSWTEEQRLRMAMNYYRAINPETRERQSADRFLVDLDFCNLFMAIQWLGWSPDWEPPPEHAQNWLTEACRVAKKLEL